VQTELDLVSTFANTARAAEAHVSVTTNDAEARTCVADILRREGARLVMVSPGAAAPPWSIGAETTGGARAVTRSPARSDRDELLAAGAGITVAAHAIADIGTLVLCASDGDHRLDSLVPPVHIALLRASAIVPDLEVAFARFAADRRFERHSAVTFVRGPSRTADIELQITIGVHGPRALHIVVLDDRRS